MTIFRSYDIRGIYGKDIDESITNEIGNILGQNTDDDVVIGIDMRKSSKIMKKHFINGVLNSGKNVVDIGLLPLGAAMYYAWKNKKTLAYLTASHLPKEWAGIKFFHSDGRGFMDNENYHIRDMFIAKKFVQKENGSVEEINSEEVMQEYRKYLLSKIKMEKKIKVTIDCGNGMSSIFAPQLFLEAGCDVSVKYEELKEDSERNSEPNLDPLTELRNSPKDIGIAYDGDADRMILVTDKGEILSPEKTSHLILSQLKEEGPIIANVECSRSLDKIISEINITDDVIRIPVGHTYLAEASSKNNARFGVESSGHYILPSLVPFDDALAVSFFACYALSKYGKKLSEIVKDIPSFPFERINFECDDEKKFDVIEKLKNKFSNDFDKVNTMDGVRVDFDNGWILIRASNTSPIIRLTVEADNEKELENLKKQFSDILKNELVYS